MPQTYAQKITDAVLKGNLIYCQRQKGCIHIRSGRHTERDIGQPADSSQSLSLTVAYRLQCLQRLQGITDLPLSLDSSHVEVLEAALRHYPGRALVNSVSYETEKFEKLLPIVQKYGAMFILLPLSDKGLPENLEEKKQIIDCIVTLTFNISVAKAPQTSIS